jgi:hydrogenase maturation protein HypF
MDRRAIAVSGIVQGVGFRPFVHGLAARHQLNGFIKNVTGEVLIEVEGEAASLDRFLAELKTNPPPLAFIEEIRCSPRPPRGDPSFRIDASEPDAASTIFVAPDVATCDDCLAELFDPSDRRYGYPFLNCTNCGPRLTIITGSPYDRERTTMASFPMCPACGEEYHDPSNRRFHAQPTACPICGPRLEVRDDSGRLIPTADPIAHAVASLRDGQIGAVKGLGGYHLACAADDPEAVARLRQRKHRDEKPFAMMMRDLEAVRQFCEISPSEEALLASSRRPIVLLARRHGIRGFLAVTPSQNPRLGVMLPYTPLHHLLLHALDGGSLVLTSGNRSDEPIAFDDDDALTRLTGIADFFLTHDRPIQRRCDDSVTRVIDNVEAPIRRSRGDAPQPITLPIECEAPTLAVGGQLKSTFALGRGRHVFVSHHLGDLDHYAAVEAFRKAASDYEQLFALQPERIAHDLHPDYASTRFAFELSEVRSRPLVPVQHHHAHMASCMAEHGLSSPVIGVTFDGTGFGPDGTIWGGEFLIGDYRGFRRAARLRPVAIPGGEQAIHEPWRMAAAYLVDAGVDRAWLAERDGLRSMSTIERIIERRINSPLTSSAGRLFDGVAALAGVRSRVTYEGQAAVELEWLAHETSINGCYPFELTEAGPEGLLEVDVRELIHAVASEARRKVAPAVIARRFHSTVVEAIAGVCARVREETTLNDVVLSGGVFLNGLLTSEVVSRLSEDGFAVYRHRRVPPNDGGLCLGQIAVAAAQRSN